MFDSYGARLPEYCAMISRKLVDPNIPSPACLSSSKRKPHTALGRKPGVAPSKNSQSQPRRTLQRMLTDEARSRLASRRPSVLPSLTRSATTPAAPYPNREGAETPLSAVSARGSQPLPVSRGGILGSKWLGQREVDFCRTANRAEIKRATQVAIKGELEGAIATVKKPNRTLAVQDYVNSCDRRTLDPATNGRGRCFFPVSGMIVEISRSSTLDSESKADRRSCWTVGSGRGYTQSWTYQEYSSNDNPDLRATSFSDTNE